MDIESLYKFDDAQEKPLDTLVTDGGFCGIFRTLACIGDSLSSGEFEAVHEDGSTTYHDYYEYSWGQYMARTIGSKVYNFSRGGMTAREYCNSFAEQHGFWNADKLCQGYIMALGVNDITQTLRDAIEFGSVEDVDVEHPENSKPTVIGYYGRILAAYKKMQPKARFFLMTMPKSEGESARRSALRLQFAEEIYKLAELFSFTYVMDFGKYAPVYDEKFRKNFYMSGHLNAAGYMLTAKMVMSYMDFIIRHNMEDFTQIGFVGTPYHNVKYKW